MDINYYLTVGNCALFANVLKVELSKELTDEKLNDFSRMILRMYCAEPITI